MKFTNLAVSTLLPFLALSSPVPEADALAFDNTPNTTLEKRSIAGTVDADELKYRRCPRQTKACDAIGEYPRGKTIYIDCYTATDTTTVNGDP
jgi:hypothetical protein